MPILYEQPQVNQKGAKMPTESGGGGGPPWVVRGAGHGRERAVAHVQTVEPPEGGDGEEVRAGQRGGVQGAIRDPNEKVLHKYL